MSDNEWHHYEDGRPSLHMPSYHVGYTSGESSGWADWQLPFEEYLSIDLKFDHPKGANDIVKAMNWMIKELEARDVKIPDEFLEND